MTKISCVIFDLDGTITQTNELIFTTFNHVAQKYMGKTYTPDEIIAMFGPPEEVILRNFVGSDRSEAAMNDFLAFYEQRLPELAETYDGIGDIFKFLRSNEIRMAVFTGKGTRTTRLTLRHFGIDQYFDVIVSGTDVVRHKPSSEGITKILQTLHVAPAETLMVGDAVSDVKAAREAGVSIASVLWDSYGKDLVMEMDVDYRFHSVADFDRWLKTFVKCSGEKRG